VRLGHKLDKSEAGRILNRRRKQITIHTATMTVSTDAGQDANRV